jgi:hypothetical protein
MYYIYSYIRSPLDHCYGLDIVLITELILAYLEESILVMESKIPISHLFNDKNYDVLLIMNSIFILNFHIFLLINLLLKKIKNFYKNCFKNFKKKC